MRRSFFLFVLCCLLGTATGRSEVRGRLRGTVLAEGTPQLGAVVIISPESRPGNPLQLMTDRSGNFLTQPLPAGFYAIQVRLSGFLPAFEPRVQVSPGRTTVLRIQLGSIFSSIELLRRTPNPVAGREEWSWVLRSATFTRPVLRYAANGTLSETTTQSRGRVELTAGGARGWSPQDPQPLSSTGFLYDQPVARGHLLLAGRIGYQHGASGGFATTWAPRADVDGGTATTLVFRQAIAGSTPSPLRGLSLEHVRHWRMGDRLDLEYGAEYLTALFNGRSSVVRPMTQIHLQATPTWAVGLLVGPSVPADPDASPLDQLDSFPVVLLAGGRPVLEVGWHEEFRLQRERHGKDRLTVAVFHDSTAHTALLGRGEWESPEVLADPFSDAFAYDGGPLNRWGTRLVYQRKLSEHWQASALCAWSRTLQLRDGQPAPAPAVRARYQPVVGARLAGQLERWGTELAASYQWIPAAVLIRPDSFGDHFAQIDPYLNVSIRQPLPAFLCCRLVAMADLRNVLAQGYSRADVAGREIVFVPLARTFRGGLAVQF